MVHSANPFCASFSLKANFLISLSSEITTSLPLVLFLRAGMLEKRRSTTIRARCTGEGISTGEQGCSLEEGAVDKLLVGELGG